MNGMRHLVVASRGEAVEVLKEVGVDPYGIDAMVPKMNTVNVIVEGLECKVANIMKQEMLSIGGDVAVSRGSIDCSIGGTDAVIIGSDKQMKLFVDKISIQPFGLKRLSEELKQVLRNMRRLSFTVETPQRTINFGTRTAVMGILNVTPDSFSDGGRFATIHDAVANARQLEEEGADIIDIGGESTRPGSESVPVEEELDRVIPVIRAVKRQVEVPLSIDTTKAAVAARAIDEGVEIVNDISALRWDREMASVIAARGVPVVLMHMKGTPQTMQDGTISYRSLMADIIQFLRNSIDAARAAGIPEERIIIDPGVGFGKTVEHNCELLWRLSELKTLGRPILIGPSRKRFIGAVTGGEPRDREDGTAATVAVSIMNGAQIVRVHDVKSIKKVAVMTDAIVRGGK
jgi:dihydropteroate synthase